jgi:hypothetical protein
MPKEAAPGGTIPPAEPEHIASRPASASATPDTSAPGGTVEAAITEEVASRPAVAGSIPAADAPGGVKHRQAVIRADSTEPAPAGSGPGQTAELASLPKSASLSDPALEMAAAVLDDLERVKNANANRLRQLTRSVEDSDGELRGFGLDETHPDVARLAAMVDALVKLEHYAELNLKRALRKHPLHGWVKSMRGVGEKQAARLLAVIGDPYIRPALTRADGTELPEGPRTVSALWAYCGLHVLPVGGHSPSDTHTPSAASGAEPPGHNALDTHASDARDGGDTDPGARDTHSVTVGVAPRRRRGERANWSTIAKTRAYLIAESCIKQLDSRCRTGQVRHDAHDVLAGPAARHLDGCTCSPYRVVYDQRRTHTRTTRPEWTDGHAHADAMRVASKAVLRDLWRAARDLHEGTAA